MSYDDFLHRLIAEGVEAARRDYSGDDPHRRAKLAGAIDGFEDCRARQPAEIRQLLEGSERSVRIARSRLREGEISADDYWRVRCRQSEVEWVANCVSAVLMNQGLPVIMPPTARAILTVARIVGVRTGGA